ncbi:MAG: TPM domain-containing protein [Ignavibacteriales bacterium]|nr:MAG: TPM domain-containing protein [Ignavibacteriales bacterium]
MKKKLLYHFIDDDDLLRITKAVRNVESTTQGEICVSIKEQRSFFEKKKTIKQLADSEFFKQGVNKTKFGTGILIFLILKERQFYILGDKGINEKVTPETWDSIKNKMQEYFNIGEFGKGIKTAVEMAGEILTAHFPIKPDDKNELSDTVKIS